MKTLRENMRMITFELTSQREIDLDCLMTLAMDGVIHSVSIFKPKFILNPNINNVAGSTLG